jgi:hypothetical protein
VCVVWCIAEQCGVVWCGVVWCSLVWFSVVLCCVFCCGGCRAAYSLRYVCLFACLSVCLPVCVSTVLIVGLNRIAWKYRSGCGLLDKIRWYRVRHTESTSRCIDE